MNFLIIVLLTLFSFQEKPVQLETKKAEVPFEKHEEKTGLPSILPIPLKPRVVIPTEFPAEIKTKTADNETKTFTPEEVKQLIESTQGANGVNGITFENGAFYTKIGNLKIPLPGGGASGCLGTSTAKTPEVLKNPDTKIKDEKENSDKPKQQ